MRFAIFAAARNEKHIIEWLNYYIKLGFDYIYIFDDLSDKPIEEVFNENNIDKNLYSIYRKESDKYLYENLNSRIQNITYSNNFWMNYLIPDLKNKNIDFVFQIDIDEFLFLNTFKNINSLAEHYMPFDVLKINWLFFGSSKLFENNTNSIINTFNKSNTKLCKDTGALKSLTRISKIDIEKNQYGPHCLPILKNSIVKNIFNNILPTYENISELTPFLSDNDSYINNIYIAHYSCQDYKTFIKRKFTNKGNVQWMIGNRIQIKSRKEAFKYVDFIISNFEDFSEYFYLKKNRITNEKTIDFEKKLVIPIVYIDNMIGLFSIFDMNQVINNDIINFFNLNKI
jgi:hypothetical protein